MSNRSEKIAAIRRDANRVSEGLEKLARELAEPDFSDLSFDELRLLRSLSYKASGCRELADVSILKLGKGGWNAPKRAAECDDSQCIELGRLMPAEKEVYLALVDRIVMPNECGAP